jgi:hypothetical protein
MTAIGTRRRLFVALKAQSTAIPADKPMRAIPYNDLGIFGRRAFA